MDLPDPDELARHLLDVHENPATASVVYDPSTGELEEDPIVVVAVESVEVRVVHTWVVTNASGARRRWSVASDPRTGEVFRQTWEGLPPA